METRLADYVFGHEKTLDQLTQSIVFGRPSQSLLVVGASQIGKTTLAQAFALALNCLEVSPPCGHCAVCRKAQQQNHPDLTIFDDTQNPIKIEQIRTLQHSLSLKPHESRYKIAILCNFERATTAAANALLKILEEPPAHVILILTAQTPTQLLPTIVSRCQIVQLWPIPDSRIEYLLQTHWGSSQEAAKLLSRLAFGRLGWAVTALTDEDLLVRRARHFADIREILPHGEAFRLSYAQMAAKDRQRTIEMLNSWLLWWRDILLVNCNFTTSVVNIDQLEALTQLAAQLTRPQIIEAVKQTYQALQNLNYNVNQRLNLEVLLLNWPILPELEFGD